MFRVYPTDEDFSGTSVIMPPCPWQFKGLASINKMEIVSNKGDFYIC